MKAHVFAIPTDEGFTGPGILIGEARTIAEAVALCEHNNLTVIREDEGGNYDQYDAEDAPRIYGYAHDGLGAISITVKA